MNSPESVGAGERKQDIEQVKEEEEAAAAAGVWADLNKNYNTYTWMTVRSLPSLAFIVFRWLFIAHSRQILQHEWTKEYSNLATE